MIRGGDLNDRNKAIYRSIGNSFRSWRNDWNDLQWRSIYECC